MSKARNLLLPGLWGWGIIDADLIDRPDGGMNIKTRDGEVEFGEPNE